MDNLLSATGERVYFKNVQSQFLLVSAGWIAAYAPGRTAAELIGKTDFDVFSDQHASAAFRDEQQVTRTGEPIVGKVEIETYGGRTDTWVSTTKMPLRDARGRHPRRRPGADLRALLPHRGRHPAGGPGHRAGTDHHQGHRGSAPGHDHR
jgi:hypothetical protein